MRIHVSETEAVVKRFEELTEKLAYPTIYDRQDEYKQISSERSSIEEVVAVYKDYQSMKDNMEQAKEILKTESDEDLRAMAKEELSEIETEIPPMEERLKILLLPKDPLDDKNVMGEIRAGAGGDEASIFVGDVYLMYLNFIRDLDGSLIWSQYLKVTRLKKSLVKGDKVFSKLKYESGVHRFKGSQKRNHRDEFILQQLQLQLCLGRRGRL